QCDMLFHGLRSLFGPSVVDYPRLPYMYQGFSSLDLLYGRGFTLYGLLPDVEVDRTDVAAKIRDRFYDLIVYGSVHRSMEMLHLILDNYMRHEVLFIDGEDQTHALYHILSEGLYFNRELSAPNPDLIPIHYAIPRSKLYTQRLTPKSKVRATIDP